MTDEQISALDFTGWPVDDAYLVELGRITALWSVLESLLGLCIGKLAGFNQQDDPRPFILTAHRKHTANIFRDLPDLIYKMLSQVSPFPARTDGEIAAMKVRDLEPTTADHLMVEAIRSNVLPASRLPKVIEAWEEPKHAEFSPRTAWSLFNAFTEVAKTSPPRAQMEGSLRLSALFRRDLLLN